MDIIFLLNNAKEVSIKQIDGYWIAILILAIGDKKNNKPGSFLLKTIEVKNKSESGAEDILRKHIKKNNISCLSMNIRDVFKLSSGIKERIIYNTCGFDSIDYFTMGSDFKFLCLELGEDFSKTNTTFNSKYRPELILSMLSKNNKICQFLRGCLFNNHSNTIAIISEDNWNIPAKSLFKEILNANEVKYKCTIVEEYSYFTIEF